MGFWFELSALTDQRQWFKSYPHSVREVANAYPTVQRTLDFITPERAPQMSLLSR